MLVVIRLYFLIGYSIYMKIPHLIMKTKLPCRFLHMADQSLWLRIYWLIGWCPTMLIEQLFCGILTRLKLTSGLIGEAPKGVPNNLMPLISQVAQKKRIFYLYMVTIMQHETEQASGTIHVIDLANGHVKAIERVAQLDRFQILNLGTGQGTTVLELVAAFEKINNVSVSTEVVKRRLGDVAKSYANASLAQELIDFECEKSLMDMCADTWNWQIKNPNGYNY